MMAVHVEPERPKPECRVVLRYGVRDFDMGMWDPVGERYEPLGTHPLRSADRIVGDLVRSIDRAGNRVTFSEQAREREGWWK